VSADTLRVRPYAPGDRDAWEDVAASSWNGTFLHSRRYMSYAEDEFVDASLVVEDRKGRIVGIFPAAAHQSDPALIESHEGISYGGLVHDGSLGGELMLSALEEVAERYYHDGKRALRIKTVPHVYHRVPAGDDLYALFRLGATRTRCHLASVIDVRNRPAPRKRRARSLRKAERAGVRVEHGAELLEPFWSVLTERLRGKHEAAPFHTWPQMQRLQGLFPEQIECVAGTLDGRVVAGVVLFHTDRVLHSQYIASDDRGYETCALDLVLQACLDECGERGIPYFSLGNSTLHGGRVFNESLYRFKAEFGAGTVAHESYELPLA
jgi:hypothetical protein